jgi:L-asparaginase
MTKVLNLGGTIALAYDEAGPVTLTGSELIGESDLAVVELDPVQSNALSWTHLLALRAELLSISKGGERQAVVLTGTGTAEDVANFLHLAAPPDVRIALLVSFHNASRGKPAPGIDAALAWLRSETDSLLCLFADGRPHSYPLEKRWAGDHWDFFSGKPDALMPHWRVPASSRLDPVMPSVPIVSVGIGCGTWAQRLIELVPSEGLVVEAYGGGDVPPEIVPALEAYTVRGGYVVITSHSHPGRVEAAFPNIPGTSHELLSAGCYNGGSLTAREARMRLAIALACDPDVAPRQVFEVSLLSLGNPSE